MSEARCPCCEFAERYTEQGCFLAGYVMGYEDRAVSDEGFDELHRDGLCDRCSKLLQDITKERMRTLTAPALKIVKPS